MTRPAIESLQAGGTPAAPAWRAAKPRGRSLRPVFDAYVRRRLAWLGPLLVGAATLAVVAIAWLQRDSDTIHPGEGIGYWLGIGGSVAMLLLLVYPLRKRLRRRMPGSVALWFRVHMLLGIGGPLLIVLHSNFHLGAMNSVVALTSMLVVAGSGVVGRYLHGKVHMGLYGRKAMAEQIADDLRRMLVDIDAGLAAGNRIAGALAQFAHVEVAGRGGTLAGLAAFLSLGMKRRLERARIRRLVYEAMSAKVRAQRWSRRQARQYRRDLDHSLAVYFSAVDKAANLRRFERMLAHWHILHLPLFILMVMAAVVHIVAVHLY